MSTAVWRKAVPVGVLAAAAAAVFFAWVMLGSASLGGGYDLAPVVISGRIVAAGQTDHLYAQDPRFYNFVSDEAFRAAARDAGFTREPTPFVYPPIVAFAMRPLASLSMDVVAAWWAWLSLAFAGLTIWLTLDLYLPRWNRPLVWCALLIVLCWFEPMLYGFWLGQTTAAIVPMILGALALQRRGMAWAAGLLLAIAVFIKLTPI